MKFWNDFRLERIEMNKKTNSGFIPLNTIVIYRCGWCGLPTDKDGQPLEVDPTEYLEKHKDAECKNTQGYCCPNGDESQQRQRVQITREMALDAGMPELEGQWTEW